MATRTDANNPQSGWGMNLEFECAVKPVVTAAPNKWMATRTGRSYNLKGKRFAEWGAVAQNAENPHANLQCCSLDGKTAKRMVHGEGGPACNRDAAGTQHDGGMTWITAYNACKDGGMRLCTDAEVFSEVGGYTGCGFDDKRLWTSTPWSEVQDEAKKGAPPSKWMSARYGRSYWNNGNARGDGGFGAAAHNAYKPVANLQCCSKDGSKADRKPFGNCNVDASGKTWDGGMTWSNANDICEAAGQRLCTDTEVLSGIGGRTGCGFDHHYVWTSTPWDQVPEDARKKN